MSSMDVLSKLHGDTSKTQNVNLMVVLEDQSEKSQIQ